MTQRYRKAADTFVAMLDDGSQRFVTKGEVLAENHELVAQMIRRDPEGADVVWRPLDPGDEEPKSEPEAKAPPEAAPVKAPPKAAAGRGKAPSGG